MREKRRWELAGLRVALSHAQELCSAKVQEVFELKNEWLISRLRLEEADRIISDLQSELKDSEYEIEGWKAVVESMRWQGGSTHGASPPLHYLSHKEFFVENPNTAIVPYVPPPSPLRTSGGQTLDESSVIGDSDGSYDSDLIGILNGRSSITLLINE
ncbi:hypothetical protein Dimus_016289 [Dionaea muscipula]